MKNNFVRIFLICVVIFIASSFIVENLASATPYRQQLCKGLARCTGKSESDCKADSGCTWCDCDWVYQGYDTCGSNDCASGTNACGNTLRDPDCPSAARCANWECTWTGRDMCDCEAITSGGPNPWNPSRSYDQGDGGCKNDGWCCDQRGDPCWAQCGTVCRVPLNQGCDCSVSGTFICCGGACCGNVCVDTQCSSGVCCTTGTYRGCYEPTSTVCNTWDEYRCTGGDANGCGATLEKRTNNRYCSGSSSSCTGSTTYGSWGTDQTCAATEICDETVPECRTDAALCPDDTTPPTTTIIPNGVPWNNDDVIFNLICTDAGSGCDTTHYQIINDGQSCPATPYPQGTSGTVTCPAGQVCNRRVCFYSIDNNGNSESVKLSNVFTIDKTSQDPDCYYKSIYEFDGEYSGFWGSSECLRPGWGGYFEVSGGTAHGITSGANNPAGCNLGGLRYYIWTDTNSGGPCWYDLFDHDKFNAANYPVVTVRARHDNGSAQDLWVLWQIDNDWNAGACSSLQCGDIIGNVPDDSNWHVLEKDISGVSGWDSQDICSIRIDVATSPWAHYEVDYLRVSNNGYDCGGGDGCYPYSDGCEDRDYYCTDGSCLYSYSNRNTDYYDPFVNYCSGDEVRTRRRFHDYYCNGVCTDHTSWVDDSSVEDCNAYDGCSGSCPGCTYSEYTCSGGACVFTSEDPDDNQNYCDACLGTGNWNLGGDVSNCCTDDNNEYVKTRDCDAFACTDDPNDDACCNQDSDCVWNSVCYNHGDDHPSLSARCNNGEWQARDCMGRVCGENCLFNPGVCDGPDGLCYADGGCMLDCSAPTVSPPDERRWVNSNCGRTGSYKCGDSHVCSNSYTSCTPGGSSTQVTGTWTSYTQPSGTYYAGDTITITLDGVSNTPSGFTILAECSLIKPDGSTIFFDNWGSGDLSFSYQIQSTDPLGTWTIDYCGLWSDFEDNGGWRLNLDNTDYTFTVDSIQLTVSVTGAPPDWSNTDATASVSCSSNAPGGCDPTTYMLETYTSDPGSCPTEYPSYTLSSPQTISTHVWVCGVANDSYDNMGVSTPVEFMVDQTPPISSVRMINSYTTETSFDLAWNGTDDASGIDCYVIQYKYEPLEGPESEIFNITFSDGECTTETNTTFDAGLVVGSSNLDGYTFHFRSLAKDNAGNWETKSGFDTYTKIFLGMVKFAIDERFHVTLAQKGIITIVVRNGQLIADTIRLSLNMQEAKFDETGNQNIDLDMNPQEFREAVAKIYPSSLGTFNLTVTATSANDPQLTDTDWVELKIVTPAEFPGLSWFAICLLLIFSVLIYLKLVSRK